ncbi:hypothetical protein AB0I55_18120 [Actinocatenispora sera]|uniref:hypothetical protein n=1 Tax=Actinocatenispora sera TaxID=390989 RepID=UPI0033C8FBB8
MRTVGVAARWVAHPVTVAAADILLLNDRVGKALWPGLVTGKASDVAGLVVAPAALSVLVALLVPQGSVRLVGGVALTATGTGFVLAKVTAAGNAVAVAGWEQLAGSAQVVRDPTDLVALPALLLAALVCRTVARRTLAAGPVPARPARRRTTGSAVVRRAATGGVVVRRAAESSVGAVGRFGRWRRSGSERPAARWVGALLGGPLVLVALAGTSALPQQPAVTRVLADGDQVVVAGTIRPAIGTPDRGWRRLDRADARRLGIDRSGAELPPAHTLACVPGVTGHCFRIPGAVEDPGSAEPPWGAAALWVQESTDGGASWHPAWRLPPGRWEYLRRAHDLLPGRDDGLLASTDIVVRPVAGGYQVVVANGVEGLAVRDPGGRWRRVAVRLPETSAITPLPLSGFAVGVTGRLAAAPLLALIGAVAAILATFVRCRRAAWWSVSNGEFSAVTVGAVVGLPVGVMFAVAGDLVQAWQPTIALGVLVLAGTVAAVLGQSAVPRRRAWLLILVPFVVGAGYALPYLGWSLGLPVNLSAASLLACVATVDSLAASVALGWWLGDSPTVAALPLAVVDVPPWYTEPRQS